MVVFFSYVLLSFLLSWGQVSGRDAVLRIHGDMAHSAVKPTRDPSEPPANQPILSVGKGERTSDNDERPRHRSRRDLDGDCLPNARFESPQTPVPPALGASTAIQARGIRLQI